MNFHQRSKRQTGSIPVLCKLMDLVHNHLALAPTSQSSVEPPTHTNPHIIPIPILSPNNKTCTPTRHVHNGNSPPNQISTRTIHNCSIAKSPHCTLPKTILLTISATIDLPINNRPASQHFPALQLWWQSIQINTAGLFLVVTIYNNKLITWHYTVAMIICPHPTLTFYPTWGGVGPIDLQTDENPKLPPILCATQYIDLI